MRRNGRKQLPRPSAATVISLVALFVALGGSATAAVVVTRSSQLSKNVVTSKKVKNGAIRSADIKNRSIRRRDLHRSVLAGIGRRSLGETIGGRGEPGPRGDTGLQGTAGARGADGRDTATGTVGQPTVRWIGRIWFNNTEDACVSDSEENVAPDNPVTVATLVDGTTVVGCRIALSSAAVDKSVDWGIATLARINQNKVGSGDPAGGAQSVTLDPIPGSEPPAFALQFYKDADDENHFVGRQLTAGRATVVLFYTGRGVGSGS